MLALKHLQALSSGLNGENNVFIPNVKEFKANTFQKVVVFVPGIKATVERRPNDSLLVTALELSDEYKSIGLRGVGRPGVYTVRKNNNKFEINYKSNGRVSSKDERKVVVADTKYADVDRAAKGAAKNLKAMFGANAALKCEFDLFYSPVGSRLGNMYP